MTSPHEDWKSLECKQNASKPAPPPSPKGAAPVRSGSGQPGVLTNETLVLRVSVCQWHDVTCTGEQVYPGVPAVPDVYACDHKLGQMCCNNTFKCPPSEICNCDNPTPQPAPPTPPTPPTPTPPTPPKPPPTPTPPPAHGTPCNPNAHPPQNCPCPASCHCCTAKTCACRHVCPKCGKTTCYCPAAPSPAPVPPPPPPPSPGDTWSCNANGTPLAFCGKATKGQYPTKTACNASCHATPPPPLPGQSCNPHAHPPQNCPCDDKTCKCCASPSCSCRHKCPNCGKSTCTCPHVDNRTSNVATTTFP